MSRKHIRENRYPKQIEAGTFDALEAIDNALAANGMTGSLKQNAPFLTRAKAEELLLCLKPSITDQYFERGFRNEIQAQLNDPDVQFKADEAHIAEFAATDADELMLDTEPNPELDAEARSAIEHGIERIKQ